MNQRELREKIFDRGARVLEALGVGKEIYACPLCLRRFRREAARDGTLTLEDVPAKSQGGRPLLLTCKDCNSRGGYQLDSEVARRAELQALIDGLQGKGGEVSGRGRLRLEESSANVEISADNSVNRIEVLDGQNSPAACSGIAGELTRMGADSTLHLDLGPGFHVRRAKVGDLRTAYLLAVARFGYAWACGTAYEGVRKQIDRPDEVVLEAFWSDLRRAGFRESALVLVDQPVACLLVTLSGIGVFLPRLGAPIPFEQLAACMRSGGHYRLRGTFASWPRNMQCAYDWFLVRQGSS